MANGVFTFRPNFKEFLPSYRFVVRVWIGDGKETGTSGMLYAEYEDGRVAELGSVSLYATAVENGYDGTEEQWIQMIIGISELIKGADAKVSYMVSESGEEHPDSEDEGWSETPSFEQGKFTWAKIDLLWIDGTKTTIYTASYQGRDGSVTSVNGKTGDVFLHGENLPIAEEDEQSIKDYIDESVIPEIATVEDIDSLFSMVFFSGSVFVNGRKFVDGDYVKLRIEPLTPNAPMTANPEITIYPTDGYSWRFSFGPISFRPADLDGHESMKFDYRVREIENGIPGTNDTDQVYETSMTLYDQGDGTIRAEKAENWNALHFRHEYIAAGRIAFKGTATLIGRSMPAREFTFKIMEGDTIINEDITTIEEVESEEPADIIYPQIVYTLEDVGLHTYTVSERSVSKYGVTVSDVVYTVTVDVTDQIRDGILEIHPSENWEHLDFVNVYNSSGSLTFEGTTTIVNRKFVSKDVYQLSVTGSGKLPTPAVLDISLPVGETSVDFAFNTINYTLEDLRDINGKYLTTKTFTYEVAETALLPGTIDDDTAHTINVKVTDDRHGNLTIEHTYSDGAKLLFTDTYDASGSIVIHGTKTLHNRKYVAGDRMTVTLSTTNSGRLPSHTSVNVPLTIGENVVPFAFEEITYLLSDLAGDETRTFNYVVTEVTTIPGATNDNQIHSLEIQVTDNWDGTFTVVPTYVDGDQVEFVSIYDATGYLNVAGTKTITNRVFGSSDSLTVELTSSNGNLPNTTVIPVSLTLNQPTADFAFNRITYKVADLQGADYKTFNYTVTETAVMPGTVPASLTDSFPVLVTDLKDGTLDVVPTYTKDNKVTFNNIYSAEGTLSFKTKVIFTNGDMAGHPFTIRATQVTGNNSTTQATSNVMLSSPVSLVANVGSEQVLDFTNIVTFHKNSNTDETGNMYWFMLEEIVPELDAQNLNNNIQYDPTRRWININVTDDGLGHLIVTKNPAASTESGLDITFTNEQLCDLSITTVWTGDDNLLTAEQKNPVSYLLTGPNSFSETFTYSEMFNGTKNFLHLHLGTYTLTQANFDYDGFIYTATYNVGTEETNIAVLNNGTAKNITVTNDVFQLRGDLMFLQNWRGDYSLLPASYKNQLTFTITGPYSYSNTFTYADFSSDSYTLYQLRPGRYVITESNTALENYDVDVSYQVGANTTNIVDLTYHGDTINITNDYNKLEASLTIVEMWTGDHYRLTHAQKSSVHYIVTGPKQVSTDAETYRLEFTSGDMVGGIKTLNGLTLGTYTVSETNNEFENFEITDTYNNGMIATNSVTLADADSKTITVANAVNKLEATLTITNVWAGDYARLTEEQRNNVIITVTGPKQVSTDDDIYRVSFTYGEMENGVKTLDRLTLGEYSVLQTNNTFETFVVTPTYRTNGVETNSITLADGDSKTMAISTDVNKLEGTITVTRTWGGDVNRLTEAQINNFTFTVSGPKQMSSDAAPYSNTFTYGDMVNGSMVIEHLTLGTYTVTESNNVIENFDITSTWTADGSDGNSVTIADGDVKGISVSTSVNKLEGSLTVTKILSGDYTRLTRDQINNITFTVSGPKQMSTDSSAYRNVFTYADMTNGSITFERLTLGTYTVTESNNTFENFELTTVYTVDDIQSNSVTIADGDSKTFIISTNVNKLEASLTISKIWTGDYARLSSNQINNVTFTVTGPKQISTDASAYQNVFTYADMTNGSITFDRLTLGLYTVTESNNTAENFDITTVWTADGSEGNSIRLADGDSKTLAASTNVNKLEGSLTITKAWNGDHERLTNAQKNGFTYTVTGPKQISTSATTFSATFTYADMTNGSKVFEGLTLGTYTVTETNNTAENFSITTTYTVDGNAGNSAVVTDGQNKTITITSNVNKLEGSLTITNTWTGDVSRLTTAQRNNLTFTVTGPQQYVSDPDIFRQTFTWAQMTQGSKTFEHLTLGTYTVTVSNDEFENFEITRTGTMSTILEDGDSDTIAITHNVNKLEGSIAVTKTWTGDHNKLTSAQKNDVVFTITGPKQISTDQNPFSATFTYADMAGGARIIDHLTPGTYTVTETNYTFNRFDTEVSYNSENGAPVNRVTIRDGNNATVNVTNKITEHKGTVKVTKLFTGIEEIPEGFEITNDYNSFVFTPSNASNVHEVDGLTAPFEWTIYDVPEGTVIEFTEANYEVSGYTLSAASETTKSSPAAGNNTTVSVGFVNIYDEE